MGTCWYAYWGWSKTVYDIYVEAVKKLDGNRHPLLFGPAHIVWEDENWDCVDWCLDHFNEHRGSWTGAQLEVVKWSLLELQKVPLYIRAPEPDDYDDEHPENYPPAVGIEMVDCT